MKKYLSYIVALTIILIGLSSCHTSAPRLDYKALAQASVRLGVDIELQDNHKLYIPASELREGDLVFFTSRASRKKVAHVGIYLKDGKFIHASTSQGVIVSNLREKYYTQHWLCGGRIK